jgi:uncharacterized protein (UPF0332 family)
LPGPCPPARQQLARSRGGLERVVEPRPDASGGDCRDALKCSNHMKARPQAARERNKRLEKMTGDFYGVLHDLTENALLDRTGLDRMVADIVEDRLALARSSVLAARHLVRSGDLMIRRSAVGRAYYGAYHAARATLFAVHRRDQDDHDIVARSIGTLSGLATDAAAKLKELRQLRNEFDYSPYPGPSPRRVYEAREMDVVIRASVRDADQLVRTLAAFLRARP